MILAISFSLSVFVSYVFPYKVFGQIPLPDQETLIARRQAEVATNFVVQPPDRPLRPAERVSGHLWRCRTYPRKNFGAVG